MQKNHQLLHPKSTFRFIPLLLAVLLAVMGGKAEGQEGETYDTHPFGGLQFRILRAGQPNHVGTSTGTSVTPNDRQLEEILLAAEYVSQFVSARTTTFGLFTYTDFNGWGSTPGDNISVSEPNTGSLFLSHPAVHDGEALFKTIVHEFGHNFGIGDAEPHGTITLPGIINHGRTVEPNQFDPPGHLPVANWIMGGSSWSGNSPFFSEIELAIISNYSGISVNLANHFGYSEYRDGQTIAIRQDFAGSDNSNRFASGTWSSNSMLAVGLHLVGEYRDDTPLGTSTYLSTPNNTIGNWIMLDANLSLTGYGGTGIRIENNNNTVAIASGRTVRTDGELGVGVLITRGSGSTFTNNGTIIASGLDGQGVWAHWSANEITNNGTITANGTNGRGIHTQSSVLTLTNTGTITANGATGYGIHAQSGVTTLTNSGTINVGGTNGHGIRTQSSVTTLTNSGTINANNTNGRGIDAGGSITTLTNSGTINANGASGYGVWSTNGINSFVNSGTINANGNGGRAVQLSGSDGQIGLFVNSGTINANGNNGYAMNIEKYGNFINNGSINATGTGGTALRIFSNAVFHNNNVINAPDGYAIDINQNGVVNFMTGTEIHGDIRAGDATLSFGYLADADGKTTDNEDVNFSLIYDGNITSWGESHLSTDGGYTSLTGTNYVYIGEIRRSSELNIQGYSSFAQYLSIHSDATLSGNGIVASIAGGTVNYGTITPGNEAGEIATLTIEGQFTNIAREPAGPYGTFLIDIDPSHGLLNKPIAGTHNDLIDVKKNVAAGVDGTALIEGGIVVVNSPSNDKSVTAAPARYAVGSKYVFLQTEDGLDVEKALDVQTVENILLFDFVGKHNKKSYLLEVERQYEYGKFGDTYNQVQVGNAIDRVGIYPDPERDIFDVLVALDQLNKDAGIPHREGISKEAKFAEDQMSGAIYGSLANASIQNTTIVNNTLSSLLRRGAFSDVVYGTEDGCETDCESMCEDECGNKYLQAKRNLWALGYGMGGKTQHDGNAYGYNQRFGGTIFGVDTYNDDMRFGAYFSYGEGRISSDLYDRVESREFMGGLYFRREMYCGYFMANAGLGYNRYDTYRNINFLGRKTDNRHGGIVGTFYVERGLEYELGSVRWQPYLGLQFVANHQNGFEETGGGDVSLYADEHNGESFRSMLGSHFSVELGHVATGWMSLHLNAVWMHEYCDPHSDFTAQFTDLNMSRFTVRGNDIGKDWAILQFGMNHEFGRISLYAGYDIYMNNQQVLHTGNVGFSLDW